LLGHERLHHLREALVGDQEPLGAVLVHLAERGCAAVPLRQPCEHPLARLFEIRLLPLLGHWLGHRPPPRRRYRHPALTAIRRMLPGDTLEWGFEGARRKIRFLSPEVGVVNVKDPMPLHISALGPRGRTLTAELGAGWINATGHVGAAKASAADMLGAWRAA